MMFAVRGMTGKTWRVLLVEDDEAIATVYKLRLQMDGFEVLQASDGEEALRIARDTVPDLILLDIRLPKLDGFGVLEGLKLDDRTARVPVVVVSNSLIGSPRMDQALTMGALEWLIKSLTTPAQLSDRARYWLEGEPATAR